jgi:hypothetical protein
MNHLLRKNQRVLMLIVAVLTIVAFIFLYNTATIDKLSSVHDPTIYGKSLNPGAIDRQVKNYQLTVALGQYDLLSKLGGAAADRNQALNAFVWNLLVLQHEARALGVEPTVDQVADRIKTLPVFQTENQFDPTKYSAFVRDQLAPRGFTERQLEEVMRDAIRVERIGAIVEAPAAVSDAELRESARILQPITATAVTFDAAEVLAAVTVPDQEVTAYYERNLPQLNTQETRAVRFVAFELPVGAVLEGKGKVEAMQKLADSASAFVDKLSTPGATFEASAQSLGLAVRETPAFDRSGALAASGDDATAKQLAEIVKGLAPSAFLLAAPGSTSDVIQAGDGFYVIGLSQVNPSRPLTLEEAAPAIRERLRSVAAEQSLRQRAAEKIKQLREALAAGKPIETAVSEVGLKSTPLEGIVPTAESVTPEQRAYIFPTLSLREGEVSNFEPGPGGGFAVYLKSRGPLDETVYAERREEILSGLLESKRELLFAEWLRTSRDAAKINVPAGPQG